MGWRWQQLQSTITVNNYSQQWQSNKRRRTFSFCFTLTLWTLEIGFVSFLSLSLSIATHTCNSSIFVIVESVVDFIFLLHLGSMRTIWDISGYFMGILYGLFWQCAFSLRTCRFSFVQKPGLTCVRLQSANLTHTVLFKHTHSFVVRRPSGCMHNFTMWVKCVYCLTATWHWMDVGKMAKSRSYWFLPLLLSLLGFRVLNTVAIVRAPGEESAYIHTCGHYITLQSYQWTVC